MLLLLLLNIKAALHDSKFCFLLVFGSLNLCREGSIIASRFLSDGKAPAAPPAAADPAASPPGSADGSTATEPAVAASNSKVLKLGEFSMKRLRNGDVYKVGLGSVEVCGDINVVFFI